MLLNVSFFERMKKYLVACALRALALSLSLSLSCSELSDFCLPMRMSALILAKPEGIQPSRKGYVSSN